MAFAQSVYICGVCWYQLDHPGCTKSCFASFRYGSLKKDETSCHAGRRGQSAKTGEKSKLACVLFLATWKIWVKGGKNCGIGSKSESTMKHLSGRYLSSVLTNSCLMEIPTFRIDGATSIDDAAQNFTRREEI